MKITVNGSVCGNDTALDIHRATIQVNGPRPGNDVPVTVGELDPLLADRIFWKHDAVLCNLFTENGSFSVVVRGLVERLIVANKPVTRLIVGAVQMVISMPTHLSPPCPCYRRCLRGCGILKGSECMMSNSIHCRGTVLSGTCKRSIGVCQLRRPGVSRNRGQ